jgi:hypothetical protein
MKIKILEKCRVNGADANPGDILEADDTTALELEAHGYAAFHQEPIEPLDELDELEAGLRKEMHAEKPAQHKHKRKSHHA